MRMGWRTALLHRSGQVTRSRPAETPKLGDLLKVAVFVLETTISTVVSDRNKPTLTKNKNSYWNS